MKKMFSMLLLMSLAAVLFLSGCGGSDALAGSSGMSQTTLPFTSGAGQTALPSETTLPTELTVPAETLDPVVYYITEPYIYPKYDPEASEGYLEKCQVPEETLAHMTTHALLETVLTYPKLPDYLGNELPLAACARSLNSMEELLQREDLPYVMSRFPADELQTQWPHAVEWFCNALTLYTQGAQWLLNGY